MRYSKIYFLLAVFSAFSGKAQIDVGAQLGGAIGAGNSKSFNVFCDVYNAAQDPSEVKDNLKLSKLYYGYNAQVFMAINKLYCGIGILSVNANARANFSNNTSRVFILNQSILSSYIGYSKRGNKGDFAIYTGFGASNTFITTYLKYANNDKDYVNGAINGTYHTVGFGVPLVIEKGFNLNKKTSLFFKAETFYSATKFTFYRAKSGPASSSLIYNNAEVIDDLFKATLQIGLKYTIHDIDIN